MVRWLRVWRKCKKSGVQNRFRSKACDRKRVRKEIKKPRNGFPVSPRNCRHVRLDFFCNFFDYKKKKDFETFFYSY